jgi:NAD(P)-dependent dehydrogenase (short-subunit alcohol dehydrogenase family)
MPRLVVVTGGANGLGQGIVRRLAGDGYRVLFCDVDTEGGAALAAELSSAGLAVDFLAADVSAAADVARLGSVATGLGDPVYGVVNNAGIFPRSPFLQLDLGEWNRVIATNLTGPFLVSQTLAPAMLAAGEGAIVNLASGLAFRGDPLGAHYASSKHGIRGLTKSLALALAPTVRVNAIAPGVADTAQALQGRPHEELVAQGRGLPLGRIAQPADIARAVAFLLSPEAGFITGQTIPVNGGADMP